MTTKQADGALRATMTAVVIARAYARHDALREVRDAVDNLPHDESCDLGRFAPDGSKSCNCPIDAVLAAIDALAERHISG